MTELQLVKKLAAYPLENFNLQGKPASTPLFGASDWILYVGDVIAARKAVEARKLRSRPVRQVK